MASAGGYKLRFYEKDPTVKFTVELLFAFPGKLQIMIGSGFSRIAEKDYRANELLRDFKSLGTEKVLALHQGQMKRRAYDQLPSVHQAMTYLMILPADAQKHLAEKVNDLMGFVQEYLRICRNYGLLPQPEILQKVIDTYVAQGPASAKMLLNAVQVTFQRRKEAMASDPSLQDSGSGEAIASKNDGMRVTGDQDTS